LLRAKKNGDLPDAAPLDPVRAAQLPIRLGFIQSAETPPTGNCDVVGRPVELMPKKGQVYGISGARFSITSLNAQGKPVSQPLTFDPDPYRGLDPRYQDGGSRDEALSLETFTVVLPGLRLRLQPAAGASVRLCQG
jgi:hypothetical protein